MNLPLRRAGLLACALFSTNTALAETALEPITISSTRLEPTADILPVGAVILDREDIDNLPADNLADVLDSVGGVTGRRLYGLNGSRTGIDLLGFGVTGTQNTLVLVNGRRLNQVDLAPVDFSAIPVQAIERIEVLPASGAVLYGNGAVGGAINIVTREQYDSGLGITAQAGEYSTHGGNLRGSYREDNNSALLSLQHWSSDGYRDNNETRQKNAFADFRHHNGPLSAGLTVLADDQQLRLPGPRRVDPNTGVDQITDDPIGTSTPNDWADQQGLQVFPTLRALVSDSLEVQVDGALRLKEQQYYVDQGFGYTSYTESESRGAALNPRLNGLLTVAGIRQQWSLGIDLETTRFERRNSLNEETFDTPIHDVDIEQETAALYLLDAISLGDNTVLTLGARHEWVGTDASDSYDGTAPTVPCCGDAQAAPFELDQDVGIYSAGIRQWIGAPLSVFVNFERNARYATVDEFFELDPANFFVSSLDPLKVQTGKITSIGAQWQQDGQHSTLTAWQGDFSNEIHYDPAAAENVNLDDTHRYGVSLNSRWQLSPALWFTLNGSYQRARFDKGPYKGEEVPLVPRQSGYLQVDWSPAELLTVSLAQRYVGKKYFDNDQANDFGRRLPSYRWTDLEFRVDAPGNGPWAKLGVYNLQDRRDVFDYGVSSSFTPGVYNGYPLPDKHLMLTLGMDL